jgi:putative serine protease PepD|nr:trypsin-like peptidase domain-containing protein [Nocardioides agariphilus]
MPAYAPAEPGRRRQERGKVSRWVWPVVCSLALVVGGLAGALGGAAYERWVSEPDGAGRVVGGLENAGATTEPPLPAENGSVAAVARQVLPSTVQIVAEYDGQPEGATGSGFVLDSQGHFVTNNHVVADAAENDGPIEIVDQDGNRYDAVVVGRSPTYDLAVLYVEQSPGLPPAALGASRALHVGDSVVAFGSPLGLSSTVTAGIVSALNRPVSTGDSSDELSYINAVQTDAAINPGNSGGPLVNLRGQVVGVNSAIATTGGSVQGEAGSIGVGFAIPIEQVKLTADQILRTGQARYPVIGAKVSTSVASGARGAQISDVLSGQPADRAGLEKGDVVTAIDGALVDNQIALIVAIRSHRPGEKVALTVSRGGEELTIEVTLGSEVG